MKHTLEIDSVILEFDSKRVLQDVYLKCETENIVGLLGRNGSGKTCLMNIIHGNLIPQNHSVRINEKVILNSKRSSLDMLYLPQFNFIPQSLELKRIFKDFNLDFQEFITEFIDFEKYYKTPIKLLSGGERRIVEIYIIVSSKTKFCLLDEPFSHIMPIHVENIKKLLAKEKKNKGIIITDHLYKHIIDICDYLYLLHKGKSYIINDLQDLEKYGYINEPNNSNLLENF